MRFSAFVKVDCGYGRAGVPVTREGAAFCVAVAECPYVSFQGVCSCGLFLSRVSKVLTELLQSFVQRCVCLCRRLV
jgi:hypothetical protein